LDLKLELEKTYLIGKLLVQLVVDAIAFKRNEELLSREDEIEFIANTRIRFVNLLLRGAELAPNRIQSFLPLHSVERIRSLAPCRWHTHSVPCPNSTSTSPQQEEDY